jgi:hypothetical protein
MFVYFSAYRLVTNDKYYWLKYYTENKNRILPSFFLIIIKHSLETDRSPTPCTNLQRFNRFSAPHSWVADYFKECIPTEAGVLKKLSLPAKV